MPTRELASCSRMPGRQPFRGELARRAWAGRPPSGSCMPETRRYCFRTPPICGSMRSWRGPSRDARPAEPEGPSVSPRPTASRCSISGPCRRGRPASSWSRSARPPPLHRGREQRVPGECPAGAGGGGSPAPMPRRAFGKGDHAMSPSPFDPEFDVVPPSGGALLAEIDNDRHTVREILDEDRAIRCPRPGPGLGRIEGLRFSGIGGTSRSITSLRPPVPADKLGIMRGAMADHGSNRVAQVNGAIHHHGCRENAYH